MSKAYHPKFNGQTEMVNKSLEQYLRAFVGDKPHRWVDWLLFDEFCSIPIFSQPLKSLLLKHYMVNPSKSYKTLFLVLHEWR